MTSQPLVLFIDQGAGSTTKRLMVFKVGGFVA